MSKDTLMSEPKTEMDHEFNHQFQQKQPAKAATTAGTASKGAKVCLVRDKKGILQEKRNTFNRIILHPCSLTYSKGTCL